MVPKSKEVFKKCFLIKEFREKKNKVGNRKGIISPESGHLLKIRQTFLGRRKEMVAYGLILL